MDEIVQPGFEVFDNVVETFIGIKVSGFKRIILEVEKLRPTFLSRVNDQLVFPVTQCIYICLGAYTFFVIFIEK